MTEPQEPRGETQGYKERVVARSFLVLSISSCAAIGVVVFFVIQNRTLVHKVNHNAADVTDLRKANLALDKANRALSREQHNSCRNYETLRGALNQFHSVFRALLVQARNARARQGDKRTARGYSQLIHSLHTVTASCAQKRPPPKKKPSG